MSIWFFLFVCFIVTGSCYAAQNGLELMILSASTSPVLGLQAPVPSHNFFSFLKNGVTITCQLGLAVCQSGGLIF
jgi:hypothetical protein